MAKLRITALHLAEFKNNNIQFCWRPQDKWWIIEDDLVEVDNDSYVEQNSSYFVQSALYSIGSFSYSWSPLPSNTKIGRFSSLARGIKVFPLSHPTHHFTTSPVVYRRNLAFFQEYVSRSGKRMPEVLDSEHPKNGKPITIGNDVYIGVGVHIRPGITIGDGAIVGAFSVVSKDVEPYSVVVGNPARSVKRRFSNNVIESLSILKWHEYDIIDILANCENRCIEEFVDTFNDSLDKGLIHKYQPRKLIINNLCC